MKRVMWFETQTLNNTDEKEEEEEEREREKVGGLTLDVYGYRLFY